jgi:hypothetical protein
MSLLDVISIISIAVGVIAFITYVIATLRLPRRNKEIEDLSARAKNWETAYDRVLTESAATVTERNQKIAELTAIIAQWEQDHAEQEKCK